MRFPGLMPHIDDASVDEPGDGTGNYLVQDPGALATAQHQQAQGAAAPRQTLLRRGQSQHLLTHRIARVAGPARGWKTAGERFQHAGGDARQQPIRETRHGVLLMDHERFSQQSCGQPAGPGSVTTHAQNQIRGQLTERAKGRQERAGQRDRCLHPAQPPLAAQPPDRHLVKRDAGVGNQT